MLRPIIVEDWESESYFRRRNQRVLTQTQCTQSTTVRSDDEDEDEDDDDGFDFS